MKLLVHPVFLFALLLLGVHQLTQKWLCFSIPWADNWLDPFLMPIILGTLTLWEQRVWFHRDSKFQMSLPQTFSLALLLSIASELVLPWLSPKFTADWLDVLVIFAGTSVFYLGINRKA
jgi:hypothetical protein